LQHGGQTWGQSYNVAVQVGVSNLTAGYCVKQHSIKKSPIVKKNVDLSADNFVHGEANYKQGAQSL